MRNFQAEITKRLAAAILVTAAVLGMSALAMHQPAQNENSVVRSLRNIQTDKATLFYANSGQNRAWFVEMVLPATGESKAATENLRSIAAAL